MAKKRKKSKRSANRRSKRQSIVDKIIHDIMNPRYDISEIDTNRVREALNSSSEVRKIADDMKRDIDTVTNTIFTSRKKLIKKKTSSEQLKISVKTKKDVVKRASSYLSHMKSKATSDEIKFIKTEKELLEIQKAIDDITKVTAKLNPTDADIATYGLKASLIGKEANTQKAKIQLRASEKLTTEAAKRHQESSRELTKLERSLDKESSDAIDIAANLKEALDTITSTYSDIKNLSLNLLDESFPTATEKNVTKTQPCLLYTSPSPRDRTRSRMPSSA